MEKNSKNKWLIRVIEFFVFLILLLLIKNEFHMSDEYFCALDLNQGKGGFHFFHILSNSSAYIVWFIGTLLGFKISAFRALQVASSVMAAAGGVALIDLGIFWGLRYKDALLFSLPVIISNGFIRYGTSAYPDIAAAGFGLLSANLLIKSVARQEDAPGNGVYFKSFILSGLAAGFSCLFHLIFLTLLPGFALGIIFRLRKIKQGLRQALGSLSFYCLGILSVLLFAYTFIILLARTFPDLVAFNPIIAGIGVRILGPNQMSWLFEFPVLVKNAQVFGALFIPGVHSANRILDILFNIPRLVVLAPFCWFAYRAWKKRKEDLAIFSWIIPMCLSLLTLFVVLVIKGHWACRQYVAISLAGFGPLIMALGICALRKKEGLFRLPMAIIAAVFTFHMLFGVEGLVELLTHDSRPFRKLYRECGLHRPKPVQFPWNAGRKASGADCRWIQSYGAFGPGQEYLLKED